MLEIKKQQTSEFETQITIKPNNSSTPLHMATLKVMAYLWVLMVSLFFALTGAWPVMICTLLTVLAITLAFKHNLNAANDYERLSINSQQLVWEKEVAGAYEVRQFIPSWLTINASYDMNGDCRKVFFKMHARLFPFAKHVTYEERQQLLQLLQPMVGSAYT